MGLAGELWQSATRTCCGEGRLLVLKKKKTLSDCLVEVSKDKSLEGSETEKIEDQVGAPWSSKQGLYSLLLVKDITTAFLSA